MLRWTVSHCKFRPKHSTCLWCDLSFFKTDGRYAVYHHGDDVNNYLYKSDPVGKKGSEKKNGTPSDVSKCYGKPILLALWSFFLLHCDSWLGSHAALTSVQNCSSKSTCGRQSHLSELWYHCRVSQSCKSASSTVQRVPFPPEAQTDSASCLENKWRSSPHDWLHIIQNERTSRLDDCSSAWSTMLCTIRLMPT